MYNESKDHGRRAGIVGRVLSVVRAVVAVLERLEVVALVSGRTLAAEVRVEVGTECSRRMVGEGPAHTPRS